MSYEGWALSAVISYALFLLLIGGFAWIKVARSRQ